MRLASNSWASVGHRREEFRVFQTRHDYATLPQSLRAAKARDSRGRPKMQSVLRALNIILSPMLTLAFASGFQGVKIAGRDAGDLVGGAAAGLVVLGLEIVLTQGPKYSPWLRRWLDPRSAFEGVWLQDVFEGHPLNAIAMFSVDYERESDSFMVRGYAYSRDGQRSSEWTSTHVFIDKGRLKATYRWEGELLGARPTPKTEKTGLTDLELRWPPAFSLPMTGQGRVWHVGEDARLKFHLHRVTKRLLDELGMSFTIRQLRINAHDEEATLIRAFLQLRNRELTESGVPAH